MIVEGEARGASKTSAINNSSAGVPQTQELYVDNLIVQADPPAFAAER